MSIILFISENITFLFSSALLFRLFSLSYFLAASLACLAYLRDFLLPGDDPNPPDEPNPADDLARLGDVPEYELSIGARIK